MKEYTYHVLLEPRQKGGYIVTVPEVPGCVTYGEDAHHALEITKDALKLYVEGFDRLDRSVSGINSEGAFCIKIEHEMMN